MEPERRVVLVYWSSWVGFSCACCSAPAGSNVIGCHRDDQVTRDKNVFPQPWAGGDSVVDQ